MSLGRHSTVTSGQREELWRRYKAGETIHGVGHALGQRPTNLYFARPASHSRIVRISSAIRMHGLRRTTRGRSLRASSTRPTVYKSLDSRVGVTLSRVNT